MSQTVTLPSTNLTMVEWFIKHNVSTYTCSLDMAIAKATDHQIISEE